MQRRTVTLTGTQEAGGKKTTTEPGTTSRSLLTTPVLHTAGAVAPAEAIARKLTAADHRPSAAGTTLAVRAAVDGSHVRPVRAAGPAVVAVVVGVAEASVAKFDGIGKVHPELRRKKDV